MVDSAPPQQVTTLRATTHEQLATRIAEFVNEHAHVHHVATSVMSTGMALNLWYAFIVWSES